MTDRTFEHHSTDSPASEPRPLVAPARELGLLAPFRWLRAGWEDFKRAPLQSLGYGIVLMLSAMFIAYMAWRVGSFTMVVVLMAGFIFLGPAIAMGLYSISRQLEHNGHVRMGACLRQGRKRIGNQMIYAAALLIVFLIWARASSMVHIFFPMSDAPEVGELLVFFGIGSGVGLAFALFIFCVSAFSLPMLLDRDVDAITAMLSSVNVVLRNTPVMLLWGALIAVLVLLGFGSGFFALAVILPVIGHATWHGYREAIDADAWEAVEPPPGIRPDPG